MGLPTSLTHSLICIRSRWRAQVDDLRLLGFDFDFSELAWRPSIVGRTGIACDWCYTVADTAQEMMHKRSKIIDQLVPPFVMDSTAVGSNMYIIGKVTSGCMSLSCSCLERVGWDRLRVLTLQSFLLYFQNFLGSFSLLSSGRYGVPAFAQVRDSTQNSVAGTS